MFQAACCGLLCMRQVDLWEHWCKYTNRRCKLKFWGGFSITGDCYKIHQSCATDTMCSIQHIDLRLTEYRGDGFYCAKPCPFFPQWFSSLTVHAGKHLDRCQVHSPDHVWAECSATGSSDNKHLWECHGTFLFPPLSAVPFKQFHVFYVWFAGFNF